MAWCGPCAAAAAGRAMARRQPIEAWTVVDADGQCLLVSGDRCRAFVDEATARAVAIAELGGAAVWTVVAVSV